MQADLFDVVLFGGISLLSALFALILLGTMSGRGMTRANPGRAPMLVDALRRYEFHEGYLVSGIDPNDAFLPPDADRSAAFRDLSRALGGLHPDVPGRLAALARGGEAFVLTGRFGGDALSVTGCASEGRIVVTVGPPGAGAGREVVDAPVLKAMRSETEDLRRALDLGGAAIWTEDGAGRVIWANAGYLSLVDLVSGQAASAAIWPVPALFKGRLDPLPEPGSPRRCSLTPVREEGETEAAPLWFEVAAVPQGEGAVFCATPIDRLVAAETALRNFVQTLSKTFAHLPIGLAIFDRRRELVLFNPALVTLSTLPPAFLSGRPRLVAFLDALRDRQRMPEPKDYRGWRDAIARLEERAEQGTYEDVWALPCGQSLRVIGRPHPDGAVAFMFEDITAEVTLTRQFRGDLDLHKAVIDALPEAVAVFSGEGRRMLVNQGYRLLWPEAERAEGETVTLADAVRHWQSACLPSECWDGLDDLAARRAGCGDVTAVLARRDGSRLVLRAGPLSGGALAVRFEAAAATDRAVQAAEALVGSRMTSPGERRARRGAPGGADPMAAGVGRATRDAPG